MPGRPKKTVSPQRPKATGLPGRMATRQKSIVPRSAKTALTKVIVADRDAAAGQQHVRPGAGVKRFAQGIRRVPRVEPVRHDAARFGHLRGQGVGIGVVDLARLQRLPRLDQFIPGAEDRDARARVGADRGAAQSGAMPISAGRRRLPAARHDAARRHVLPRPPDVLARLHGLGET